MKCPNCGSECLGSICEYCGEELVITKQTKKKSGIYEIQTIGPTVYDISGLKLYYTFIESEGLERILSNKKEQKLQIGYMGNELIMSLRYNHINCKLNNNEIILPKKTINQAFKFTSGQLINLGNKKVRASSIIEGTNFDFDMKYVDALQEGGDLALHYQGGITFADQLYQIERIEGLKIKKLFLKQEPLTLTVTGIKQYTPQGNY